MATMREGPLGQVVTESLPELGMRELLEAGAGVRYEEVGPR